MTINGNKSAVGVFHDYRTAEQVVQELTNADFPRENIQMESKLRTGAAGSSGSYGDEAAHGEEKESGISGFFHRLFGGGEKSEERREEYDESGHYAEVVRRGSAVVCVTAPADRIEQAVAIMNEHDPIDIDRRVAALRETGYERHDPSAAPYTTEEAAREREQYRDVEGGATIPVVEEELQVGKRSVQRGGVRVYSHVVEQPVEEDIELREEHVTVERRPVNRPLEAGDKAGLREQSVEVTEMAEEPVIEKRARVREEVVVGKETTERKQRIKDSVKRTQVDVEPLSRDREDRR